MVEKLVQDNPENKLDHSDLDEQQHTNRERLTEAVESEAEKSKNNEQSVETAAHEVNKAIAEREHKNEAARDSSNEKVRKTPRNTKQARSDSYKRQMKEVRSHMSAPSRTFSTLIHNKAVEKTSEAVGSTIARPNALLAGSFSALVLTSAIYFWARHVGYPLSGFETIAAFIIGWLVGIIFDFGRIMITGKR